MHREVFIECVELDAWGLAFWLPLQGHQFAHLENGEPGAQQCLAGGSWEAEFTLIPQQAVFSTQHPEGRLSSVFMLGARNLCCPDGLGLSCVS